MGNSRSCDICVIDVHRASYRKPLRSKKQLENEKHNEITKPETLIKNLLKKK